MCNKHRVNVVNTRSDIRHGQRACRWYGERQILWMKWIATSSNLQTADMHRATAQAVNSHRDFYIDRCLVRVRVSDGTVAPRWAPEGSIVVSTSASTHKSRIEFPACFRQIVVIFPKRERVHVLLC